MSEVNESNSPHEHGSSPYRLRDRAERRLRTSRRDVGEMSEEELQTLVYEFQVHQVELEIQNEELRQTQFDLAESRDRLADLYEFAPVGYLTLARDSVIVQSNLAATEMLATTRRSLVEKRRLEHFVAPEGKAGFQRHLELVFASETKQVDELPMVLPGRLRRVFRVECRRIDGTRCRTVMIDITAQREAEDALRELNESLEQRVSYQVAQLVEGEARLHQLTERLRDIVWIHDAETFAIIYCNPAFERIFGIALEQLEADPQAFLHAVHPDDATRVARAIDAMRSGDPLSEEFRIVRPDGSIRWLRDRGYPVRNAVGEIYRFAGTAEDITERKAAQAELRRVEREVGEILEDERNRIARDLHDSIGSLLSTIKLRLTVLQDDLAMAGGPQPDADEGLDAVLELVDDTVRKVRSLTRGLMPVGEHPEDLDVALCDLALALGANPAFSCEFVRSPKVPKFRVDDPHVANALFRIAQEAANNAVKHSGGQQILIKIAERGGGLTLAVTDDGCGIGAGGKGGIDPGSGLKIMRYRADAIGADLQIRPGRGGGTVVSCTIFERA